MRNPFKRTGEKTATIVPNQDFLDEGFRFLKGETYKVAINRARYFERNGWLEGSIAAALAAPVLDIDNGKLGQTGGFDG